MEMLGTEASVSCHDAEARPVLSRAGPRVRDGTFEPVQGNQGFPSSPSVMGPCLGGAPERSRVLTRAAEVTT